MVGTGSSTGFGKIASGLTDRPPETGFQAGLRSFSKMLATVAIVVTVRVFIINVVLGRPLLEALLFSLAIAVGMTPEMMPAIVSVSLSAGSRVLAKKHVLVKRLVAIEDLGNIQILFTDKTGTLTDGAITFSQALGPDGKDAAEPFRLGLLCNEASMTDGGPVGGNPLDQALLKAASTPGAAPEGGAAPAWRRLGILPFDHERQMCSVLVARPDGGPLLITKGAPEAVFARCPALPRGAQATLDKLFADGDRVVAVATRDLPAGTSAITAGDERQLTLIGFLTFADRPKADAGAAVAQLSQLGVEVKIITGDNGVVAAKVCHEIGIEVAGVMTGADLAKLDDKSLAAAIPGTTVFARVSPDQKSRIITAARSTGQDVAFMGDGVNDAVAIHHADVGISVDSATDVAKDAADVVLLEKDLGVLATGVMEGRRIFANTMKYVLMATSSNFGNMFSAAGASLFLTFLPMLPSQILLNNLLYDTGQMVIPTDNVDPEQLARPAALGHQVRAALHVRLRPAQLDLRLHHVLDPALGAARRARRVPHRLVRRVDRDADTHRLRDPHPPDPIPPEPAQPADDVRPHRGSGHRHRPAVHAAEPRPRLHPVATQVLPRASRTDRDLHGAGGPGQDPLLPGAARTAGDGQPAAATDAQRSARQLRRRAAPFVTLSLAGPGGGACPATSTRTPRPAVLRR